MKSSYSIYHRRKKNKIKRRKVRKKDVRTEKDKWYMVQVELLYPT